MQSMQHMHESPGQPVNACLLGTGQWFRLHDHNKRSSGKPISFAAVHLKLDGADADERRLLYGVPLLAAQDSQNDDSGASHMTLPLPLEGVSGKKPIECVCYSLPANIRQGVTLGALN